LADIFLSYSRTDKPRVAPLVAALEAKGWSVWWDTDLSPGVDFDSVTSAALKSVSAVVVVWTPTSVTSRWVRGEARVGADRGVLVPVRFENAELPIDVRTIHTTDLDDWDGDPASSTFQRLAQSLTAMLKGAPQHGPMKGLPDSKAATTASREPLLAVLAFENLSGDPEMAYRRSSSGIVSI
jgi:adenylate cyclase